MRVGVTGATGFVGRRLVAALRLGGHGVTVFSRDPGRATRVLPDGVDARPLEAITGETLAGVDAVVNLAGEPVADHRWTDSQKAAIRDSRIETTKRVVVALTAAQPRPRVLVNASAVGFYGDRGDETVTEDVGPGAGFLAEVCAAWEAEAQRAEALGVRVVRLRIGVVLGEAGGALEQMVRPFKLGMGGPLGDGRQYLPWVHLDDVVGLIMFALTHEAVRGAMNATAPSPARGGEFAQVIARVVHRPAWFRVPGAALKLGLGEMSQMLLTGQRAIPRAALDAGYVFRHTDAEEAVRTALERR